MALMMDEQWSSKPLGYRILSGHYRAPIVVLAVLGVLCLLMMLVGISFWAAVGKEDCQPCNNTTVKHQPSDNSTNTCDDQPQTGDLATNSCPEGYVTIMGSCFLFTATFKSSWNAAREHCRENGGDLAVIDDCRMMGTIIGYIHANALEAGEGYWIGGSDSKVEGDWRWINGAQMDMDVPFWGTYSARSLNPEPAQGSSQNCIQLWKSDRYYFHDGDCSHRRPVVCQADLEAGGCPAPFVRILDDCYQFLSEEQSWSTSFAACKTLKGRMAVLGDCKAFGAVVRHIQSNGLTASDAYWVGGNDKGTEGVWLWTDGSHVQLGPPFWGKSGDGATEPGGGSSKNCAAMLKNDRYYYHAVGCFYTAGYTPLCQAPSIQ